MIKKSLEIELTKFLEIHKNNEYAENTIHQYKTVIESFIYWIPDDRKLNKELLIEYKKFLEKKTTKYTSINNWIIILNKFLKFIDRNDLMLEKYKIQKTFTVKVALTNSDYKRLLKYAKKVCDDQSYYIIKILAKTGIRISELKYFTVENLNSLIQIRSKGKVRLIFIPKELVRELRKYSREKKIRKGTLFPSEKKPEKMITTSCIWKRLKKIAGYARVNKKSVYCHSFRHLYAVNFLKKFPNDITHLADLLGHNSLETTRTYCKLTEHQMLELVEKLDYSK